MKKPGAQHLRLIPVTSTEAPPRGQNIIQSVFLPYAEERLYLRMEPCVCGGAHLYYVRIVELDKLGPHNPVLTWDDQHAEEVVQSKHVRYRKVFRFLGISPMKAVLFGIWKFRRRMLARDYGLHKSVEVKVSLQKAFGI